MIASRRFVLPPYPLVLLLWLAATTLAIAALFARAEEDDATPPEDDELPPCESPASPPDLFYACLRNGTLRERLAAARGVLEHLPALYSNLDDADTAVAAEAGAAAADSAATLLLVIRQEPDEWVSRALLETLAPVPGEAVDGLFREVLDAGSINLLPVVLRRLAYIDDARTRDALEDLWDRDLPEWIRPDLIAALASQGSTAHLDDFSRLTREGDDATRLAAVQALGFLASEEGREPLLAAARAGPPWLRARALSALVELPFAASTLEEALRESHGGPRVVQEAAIEALRRIDDEEAAARLIALLDEPLTEHVRAAAATALAGSAHPEATDALVRLAHSAGQGSCLRTVALRSLINRDDPAAVAGLSDMADDAGQDSFPTPAMVIKYLGRDRDGGREQYIGVLGCPDKSAPPDAGDTDTVPPRTFWVDPRPPFETARCWEGPDLAGDPDTHPRVSLDTPVRIADHFQRPAGEWVRIDGADADCWIPLAQVALGDGGRRMGGGRPPGVGRARAGGRAAVRRGPVAERRSLPRIEFDMWRRDLASVPVARLVAKTLLGVIEPGDEVVGVALTADPADPDQAAFLRAIQGLLPKDRAGTLKMALATLLEPPRSVDGRGSLP